MQSKTMLPSTRIGSVNPNTEANSMFIENWNKFYKMYSMWIAAFIAGVTWLENAYPTLVNFLPDAWQAYAAVILGVARLLKQKSTDLGKVLAPPTP